MVVQRVEEHLALRDGRAAIHHVAARHPARARLALGFVGPLGGRPGLRQVEGVDAIASRTLKDLLSRLTARGLTVFLTSHVLEIVERLCSDIAIIAQGKLLASGSLNELRKGIRLEGDGEGPVSLEEYFIHVVGGTRSSNEEDVLQWLT